MLVGLAAAFGVLLAMGAGNAAAFACSSSGNDVYLVMTNETVTIAKGNLSAITVNGVPCDGRTTSNTETIFVEVNNSGPVLANLIIDMGGGRFEPGVADAPAGAPGVEGVGLNEIEFVLADADGNGTVVDTFTVLGNAAPDTIMVGDGLAGQSCYTAGDEPSLAFTGSAGTDVGIINLNGDDDADVCLDDNTYDLSNLAFLDEGISILGRGGNDTISGKGNLGTGGPAFEPLILNGGDGDDSIQGGDGDDRLIGGPGNDVLDGDNDTSLLFACNFDDFINIATGEVDLANLRGDTVDYSGSTGPITADLDPGEAHPGSATGDGTDVLQNIENIIGSPGNDTLSGDNTGNLIMGGPGDDVIAGDAGDDCLLGNDGNDTFNENEGTSIAQGGTGTDNGADAIFGNAGLDDTIDYSSRTTRINVFLENLDAVNDGGAFLCLQENGRAAQGFPGFLFADGADLDGDGVSFDDENDCVFHDTENVISGSGNDLLVAAFTNNRADNEFTGNGGNDLMVGGAGNDTFHEGTAANGADDMDGGTGSDTCDYSGRTASVSVSLDGADNDGEAGEGDNCGGVVNVGVIVPILLRSTQGFIGGEGDPLPGPDVENVNGGSGNDVLVGDDDANVLNGNGGNDTISGNGGSDSINGGDGDDTLSGGPGNDAVSGGAGTDTVDYGSAGAGGVGVSVNLTTGAASGEGNDTLADVENVNGSSFADTLRGNSANNILNGRGGNDAIQGAGGDDTINGGAGNDELGGGPGNDHLRGGSGPDTIRGGAGDDRLNGGPGADTLLGGRGDDVLSGGSGKDFLRGGPGTDRCVPGAPGLRNGDRVRGCES